MCERANINIFLPIAPFRLLIFVNSRKKNTTFPRQSDRNRGAEDVLWWVGAVRREPNSVRPGVRLATMPRSGMEVRAERVLRALTRGWWRGASPATGARYLPLPLCCPEGISSLAVFCKVAAEIPSGERWMWLLIGRGEHPLRGSTPRLTPGERLRRTLCHSVAKF